eukprot:scaffold1390_cov138-Cylindrotheca_fusiformis.AAC.57
MKKSLRLPLKGSPEIPRSQQLSRTHHTKKKKNGRMTLLENRDSSTSCAFCKGRKEKGLLLHRREFVVAF